MADIERKAIDVTKVKQCGLPCYWVLGGPGSGKGKTAAKGHKGQYARSGGTIARGFEGG